MATVTNYKFGDKGDGVIAVQRQLNTQGYGLTEDGKFGQLTNNALRDFQTKNNLTVDGIYGTQTAGMFNTLVQNKPVVANNKPVVPQTSNSTINTTNAQNGTQSPYDMKFNYDATKDVGFQNATKLAQSKIAWEMAARGIGGSTIEQERIAQSIAGLNLDYTNAAYNKFSQQQQLAIQQDVQQYERKRQAISDAMERTEKLTYGIVDNEAAKILGVPVGTKTTSRLYQDRQEAQRIADKQAQANVTKVQELSQARYNDVLQANQNSYILNPRQTVVAIWKNPLLSPSEKLSQILSMKNIIWNKKTKRYEEVAGKSGQEWLDDIMLNGEDPQKTQFYTRNGINVEGATGNPFSK